MDSLVTAVGSGCHKQGTDKMPGHRPHIPLELGRICWVSNQPNRIYKRPSMRPSSASDQFIAVHAMFSLSPVLASFVFFSVAWGATPTTNVVCDDSWAWVRSQPLHRYSDVY